jgi:hypothetical protein
MLGKPGRYLMMMTYWWVMPFLIIALGRFPPGKHQASYYPFAVALAIPALLGVICNRLENRYGYWRRSGFWKRYFLLNGWYALNVGLILGVTLTLDYFHLVRYFGGDPEGSFGMLYLPSVLGYLVLGLILGVARQARKAGPGSGP